MMARHPPPCATLFPPILPRRSFDPYTGSELKYLREGARYNVYSVGLNRQDDGGVWEQRSDILTSRRGNPEDVGIAVGAWPAVPVR